MPMIDMEHTIETDGKSGDGLEQSQSAFPLPCDLPPTLFLVI